MPEQETNNIKSWKDLANYIEEYRDNSWIFRGEDKVNGHLRPAVGRPRGPEKKPYNSADEEKAFVHFKKKARPYLSYEPHSDIEWLAIARHHGVPTRLLDWTESLLVAAFFAVISAGTKGDALIYAVKGLPEANKEEENPFEIEEVKIYSPPHISPRIQTQKSVFTIHPKPEKDFQPPALKIIKIPARNEEERRAVFKLKRIIDACGINESSLFPDLDGLSKYLSWQYKWGF